MAPITASIDIARPPEDVFAYLDDLSRHGEWQASIRETQVLTEGPTRVGSRARDTRQVPGGARPITYEITAHDPPRSVSFRGVDGPVRVIGTATVTPADGGSRVAVELEFVGRGLGKLLLPLVRSQARRELPADQQRLKERLEGQSS